MNCYKSSAGNRSNSKSSGDAENKYFNLVRSSIESLVNNHSKYINLKRQQVREADIDIVKHEDKVRVNKNKLMKLNKQVEVLVKETNQLTQTLDNLKATKLSATKIINTPIQNLVQTNNDRVPLQFEYDSELMCLVCLAKCPGKTMVYMNNCTHAFCKTCITSCERKHRCMACREPSTGYYMIVQEGERYRIKSYPAGHKFMRHETAEPSSSAQQTPPTQMSELFIPHLDVIYELSRLQSLDFSVSTQQLLQPDEPAAQSGGTEDDNNDTARAASPYENDNSETQFFSVHT